MDSAVSRTWLLLSNFLALPCSERILSSVALAQGLCAFFFSFTGLFLFPQLSVGVTGAWGTHKKGDLQGDFTLSPACLVSKPWTGPPYVSPPTAAWQSELGGSLLVPAAAGHHGGRPHPQLSSLRLQQRPSGHQREPVCRMLPIKLWLQIATFFFYFFLLMINLLIIFMINQLKTSMA